MDDEANKETEVIDLRQAVEIVKDRFSSIQLETRIEDDETAVSVRLIGDAGNLNERQALVSQIVRYLPPALSLLGVKQKQQTSESKAA